jgi:RNA polymerase sigma-70 factor (sigma-E family)
VAGEFDSFVRARSGSLLRSAYFLTGDQHLAEDLVQAALARTHRAWPGLHAAAAADAYTRKTMYHLQVSWWRRRRVAETLTEHLPARAADTDLAETAALQVTLRSLLLRLPARQRAVLVLRFFDDLTEAQTADVLGIRVGTVKSQTAKALAKLRVLAPELKEFSTGTADEVSPVDLRDRSIEASRRLATRRAAATVAAVAVLVAVVTGIVTRFGLGPDQPVPPADPTPSPSPAPSAVVLPTRTEGGQDAGPFRNVTITLPAWAGARGPECPSGQIRLNDGGTTEGTGLPVWVDNYVETDVDADGDADIVAVLRCSEGPESPGSEVFAFRRDANGKPVTIGRIVGTRDGFGAIYNVSAANGGVGVELSKEYTDSGQQYVPSQHRTYRLVGGVSRQVAGPTEFGANPGYAVLWVDASDLTLRPAQGGKFAGHLTVTLANQGTVDVEHTEIILRLRGNWLKPAGYSWPLCTRNDYTDPVSFNVYCPGPALPAGATATVEFDFVADELPAVLNPEPPVEWQQPYKVEIKQTVPYTFENSQQVTKAFNVVRS